MKILIGTILNDRGEKLLILDRGKGVLAEKEEINEQFGNYNILAKRRLRINDNPVDGPGVFKFRYGPVTSGLREAGTYELYTYGEKILRATIDTSWKYRGIEEAMINMPPHQGLLKSERISNNFAFAHSVGFSQAVEMASHLTPDIMTRNWRIILLEAERIYNHLHVISKLAASAAQKVLAAHLQALFEEALRLNECLSGSRYLMGINGIGLLQRIPTYSEVTKAIEGYQVLVRRFTDLYNRSLNNHNYLDRLHSAGVLTPAQAINMGITGPSLRACGIKDGLNQTVEHLISLPTVTQKEGDALARMEVRAEEIVNSCQYIVAHLRASDSWQNHDSTEGESRENGNGYSLVNSASGALAYYLELRQDKVAEIRIFTPSYPGFHAISQALEGLIFTDFPFIVDSFGINFSDAAL